MFHIFGTPISISEFMTLLGFLIGGIGAYWKITSKQNLLEQGILDIEERNVKADSAMDSLKSDLYSKVSVLEERTREQQIFSGRVDERLSNIQTQLTRVLNIMEKK